MFVFLFLFIFLTISVGQKAADNIGRVLTEAEDPPPTFSPSEKRDDDVSADDIIIAFLCDDVSADDIIIAFLCDGGFLYFWDGDLVWHIIIA